ncbi:hypothetical protein [Duganella sp. BuS-21]|uniref:hypothetical protein n=1 Tax=Duganella sp. BuS-21 TaxID=2943848 RepID=UPI0035A636FD
MTRFAPPTLYQCPACAGYFKRSGFRSLYFDDEIPDWSDGRNGNWWARKSGNVGRCPSCSGIVWIDDAEKLMLAPQEPRQIGPIARVWHLLTGDRSGRLREEREWKVLPAVIQQAEYFDGLVHAHDFIEALTSFSSDAQDRETYLRRRIWWASSDHLRGQRGVSLIALPSVAEDVAHANMQRLLELFEHDPKEQVARGELLRQVGRFDEAVAVLRAVKPDGYSEVKAVKIERLARAGIAELQNLKATPVRRSTREGATDLPKFGGVAW